VTEGHGERIAAAEAIELAGDPLAVLLRQEPVGELDRLGLAERQRGGEHTHAHAPRAHVRAAVDDADLGVLALGGRDDPQAVLRVVQVAQPAARHPAVREQIALPAELLVPVERIQGLEHAEESTRDHVAESSAGVHLLCSRRPRPRS
jgi:hypothetical protein